MKKILMIILDGFGLREEMHGNAIKMAKMNYFNKLWNEYPHSTLEASGEPVGLPDGFFGTSEVGHETIGAGKRIKQKLSIAWDEVSSKNIISNEELISLANHVVENNSTLHVMALLSDGGVHSHIAYILKMIPILKELGVKKLVFHVITDGRDTYRMSSLKYIKELEKVLISENIGFIGTVCGRYYAMDRDNNYDRTKIYYDLIINGKGLNILNLEMAIKNCYSKNITDEFLLPLLLGTDAKINEHDGLLWLNFRADRARQIINSITNPEFKGFDNKIINNLKVVTLFPQVDIEHAPALLTTEEDEIFSLGEYFSELGFTQTRISETEKYSHITKSFNAYKTSKLKNCDNVMIPSPEVATFDKAPLMSAPEVTKQTIKALEKDYDFVLVNYANPDMLGHTGNLQATIASLEALDILLEELVTSAEDNFYKVMILSDHGNADTMLDENEEPVTTHSIAPVPFILLDKHVKLKEKGDLTMVAPTLLKYLDIAIPKEMKETKSLIIEDN